MVTLSVRPKHHEYTVHEDLICRPSEFFKKAFEGKFKEGEEGVLCMPENEPGTISLYIDWIYRSAVPCGRSKTVQSHIYNLYDLYIFADKIYLIELKDKVMDTIQDIALQFGMMDILITPAVVKKVFENTFNYKGLQRFCICLRVHCCL